MKKIISKNIIKARCMSNFQKKRISKTQILADKLRKTRLEKNIALEKVQEAIKIQTKYLEILESGQYDQLPGDIYAKAWIKLYAEFLELDSKELLADYSIEKNISNKIEIIEKRGKKKKLFKFNILKPKFLKFFFITLIITGLLGYLGWELFNIISPPKVIILEPTNNSRTTENTLAIIGKTESEVELTINDEIILLDSEGNFNQNINLAIGLNNLQISAKKKHSKTRRLELIILRESLDWTN